MGAGAESSKHKSTGRLNDRRAVVSEEGDQRLHDASPEGVPAQVDLDELWTTLEAATNGCEGLWYLIDRPGAKDVGQACNLQR